MIATNSPTAVDRGPSAAVWLVVTAVTAVAGDIQSPRPPAPEPVVADALPLDRWLLDLMNEHFCQPTPLVEVDIYDRLPDVWRERGRAALPDDLGERRRAIGRHYGLTVAPSDVQEFPLGLVAGMDTGRRVLRSNCLICHACEVFGRPVVGLANNRLDFHGFMDDVLKTSRALGRQPSPWAAAYATSRNHGISYGTTIGSTSPLTFAAIMLALRNSDLTLREPAGAMIASIEPLLATPLARHLGAEQVVRQRVMFAMRDIDQDAPAWWSTRADDRLFVDGLTSKQGRATMTFLADPWIDAGEITGRLPHAQAFFDHIDRVPLPATYAEMFPDRVDRSRVARGAAVFKEHCATCHGTYGVDESADDYPGRIIPVAEIGTDDRRARGITPEFREFLSQSWFGEQSSVRGGDEPAGYRAPYLRRVALTYPYFHNGSVPTLRHVLFPAERPARWRIVPDRYDHIRLGQDVEDAVAAEAVRTDERSVLDTSQPGKGNGGHDSVIGGLSAAGRLDVLEYLKTL